MTRLHGLLLPSLLAAPLVLLSGCGHRDERIDGVVLPDVEFARFAMGVRHSHLHLEPGNTWVYEAVTDAGTERTGVEVLVEERAFPEVDAVTVRSDTTLGGEPIRGSTGWYAQDSTGDVWQFGKEACQHENGQCTITEGSWEWTGGDARPGIVLPASPEPGGEPYYEVYYEDHVEDVAEVLALGESVTVPAGSFEDCVKIRQTSKLDPGLERVKYWCPVVGVALVEDGDVRMELMDFDGI